MSTKFHPVSDLGLVVTPTIAAYINLFHDVDMGTVPASVKPLVEIDGDHLKFLSDANIDAPGASPLPKNYFSLLNTVDVLLKYRVNHQFGSNFEGYVYPLGTTKDKKTDGRLYDNEPLLFLTINGNTSNDALTSKDLVSYFRDVLKEILPNDFQIEDHLQNIDGTFFC